MATLASIEAQLSQLIAQQETAGGTTGVGASSNNPGGIQYAPWEQQFGATQGSTGFAVFPSLQAGYQALNNLIDSYIKGGASISSMMQAYAPTATNPTTPARIQSLASALGINPNAAISTQVTTPAAAAGASGSAATPATTTAAPSVAQSAVQGALQGLLAPFGTSDDDGDTFSWARITTGIVGVALLIIGLMQLKQTQVIVQNVQKTGKRISEAVTAAG
jgi:hypothetical protein